jgi:hypothetical protein
MKIISTFTTGGDVTVQIARIDQETGVLILAESSGEYRKELMIEPTGSYELMLYLKSVFEDSHD